MAKAACRSTVRTARGRLAAVFDESVPNGADPDADLVSLVGEWLALPDVAELLHVPVTRVRKMITDRQLLAARVGHPAGPRVPAAFFDADGVLPALTGTIAVLHDSGLSDSQSLRWLFTPEDTLPGAPIQALVAGRKKEVRRRAQALAL